MQPKSAVLSRFLVRLVEITGAGLASAVCAYGLGQIGKPATSAPAPVQVSAVSEDTIRMVRDDHALLVELVKKEAEAQKKPESVAAVASTPAAAPTVAPAPKPAKPTQTVQPRRNQKPEQPPLAETRSRQGELKPGQPSELAPKTAAQSVEPALPREGPAPSEANTAVQDRPLFARLMPSWFSPGHDRSDVPRPPKPVGEFARSAM
jgi:hypothetical protein